MDEKKKAELLSKSLLSTTLFELLAKLLDDWEKAAQKTPEVVDDWIVALIRSFLGL